MYYDDPLQPNDRDTLRRAVFEAYNQPTFDPGKGRGEFARGFLSGSHGFNANKFYEQALAAKQANHPEEEAKYLELARQEEMRAAQVAPRVQNFTDINSLGQGLNWATSAAGQMLASTPGAIAGGIAGSLAGAKIAGPRGALVGGFLGAFPSSYVLERDEAVAEAMRNPDIYNNADPNTIRKAATAKGLSAGAMEAVVPAIAGGAGRAMLKGLRQGSMAHRLARGEVLPAAATEGLTEGAQSLIGQSTQNYLQNKPLSDYDWKQVLNEAAAGAVGGTVMTAPQAGLNYLQEKYNNPEVQRRVREMNEKIGIGERAAEKTIQNATEMAEPVLETAKEVANDLRGVAETKRAEANVAEQEAANVEANAMQQAAAQQMPAQQPTMGMEPAIVEYLRSSNENKEAATRNTKNNFISYKKRNPDGTVSTFNADGIDVNNTYNFDYNHPTWRSMTQANAERSAELQAAAEQAMVAEPAAVVKENPAVTAPEGGQQAAQNETTTGNEAVQNATALEWINTAEYLGRQGKKLTLGSVNKAARKKLGKNSADGVFPKAWQNKADVLRISAALQKSFSNIKAKNDKVKIYGNIEEAALDDTALLADIKDHLQKGGTRENYKGGMNPQTGKVALIASNIQPGEELGVFLHEIGVHGGLESVLSAEQLRAIVNRIAQIAIQGEGLEKQAASQALIQAEETLEGGYSNSKYNSEVVAYFVEYVVNNGLYTPNIPSKAPAIIELMNQILEAIKQFITGKYDIRPENVTPQQLVDMAWAMANETISKNAKAAKKRSRKKTNDTGDLFELTPQQQKTTEEAEPELEPDPPEILETRMSSLEDSLRNNKVRGIEGEAHEIDVRFQVIKELETIATLNDDITPPQSVDEDTFYNELDEERINIAKSWAVLVSPKYHIPEIVELAQNFLDPDSSFRNDYLYLAVQVKKLIQKQKDSFGYKDAEKLIDAIYGDQAETIKRSISRHRTGQSLLQLPNDQLTEKARLESAQKTLVNRIKTKEDIIVNSYRDYLRKEEEDLEKAYKETAEQNKEILNVISVRANSVLNKFVKTLSGRTELRDITDGQADMLRHIVRGALSKQESVSSKFSAESPALDKIAEAWFQNEFTFQGRGIALLESFYEWLEGSDKLTQIGKNLKKTQREYLGIPEDFSGKIWLLWKRVEQKYIEFGSDLGSVLVEQWGNAGAVENGTLDGQFLTNVLYNWVKKRRTYLKYHSEKAKKEYAQAQQLVDKYFIANPLEWNVKDKSNKVKHGAADFMTYLMTFGWDESAPIITRSILNNPYPRQDKIKGAETEEIGDYRDDMSLLVQRFVSQYQSYITNTLLSVLGDNTISLPGVKTTFEEIEGADFKRDIDRDITTEGIDDADEISFVQDAIESQKSGTQMTTERVSFKYDVITDIHDMGVYAAQDEIYYTNKKTGVRNTVFAGQLSVAMNYASEKVAGEFWLNKSNILVTNKDGTRAKQDPAAHKNYSYDFGNLPKVYLRGMRDKGIQVVEVDMLTGVMLKDNAMRNHFGNEDTYWGWDDTNNRAKVLARYVPFWAMYYLQFPLPQEITTADGKLTAPDVEEVKKLLAQIEYKKEKKRSVVGTLYDVWIFDTKNVHALTELGYLMAQDSRFVSYVIDRTEFQDPLHLVAEDIYGPAGWSNESIKRARQTLNGNFTEVVKGRLVLKEEAIGEIKSAFNTSTLYSTLIFRGEGILKKSRKSNREIVEKKLTRNEERYSYFNEEGWLITTDFEMPVSIPSMVRMAYKKRNERHRERDKEHPQDNSVASLVYEGIANILAGTKVSRSKTSARWHTMLLPNKDGFLNTDGVFSMLLENGETIHLSAGKYRNADNFPFKNGYNEWVIEYNNPRACLPSHVARKLNINGRIITQRIPLADNLAPVEQEALYDDVGKQNNASYWREYFRALLFFTPQELEDLSRLMGKKIDNEGLLRNLHILLPKDTIIFENGGKARADGRMTWKEAIFKQYVENKAFWELGSSRDATQYNTYGRTIRDGIYMMSDIFNEMEDYSEHAILEGDSSAPNIETIKDEAVQVVKDAFDNNAVPLSYQMEFPTYGQMKNFPPSLLQEAKNEIFKAAVGLVDTNIKNLVEQKYHEDNYRYPLGSVSSKDYSYRNATKADYIDAIYALMVEKHFGNHEGMSLSDIAARLVSGNIPSNFLNNQVPTFTSDVVYTYKNHPNPKLTKTGAKSIWNYKPNIIQRGRLGVKATPFANPAHIIENLLLSPVRNANSRAKRLSQVANTPDIKTDYLFLDPENIDVYVVNNKGKTISPEEFQKLSQKDKDNLQIGVDIKISVNDFKNVRSWLIDNHRHLVGYKKEKDNFEQFKKEKPEEFELEAIRANGEKNFKNQFMDARIGGFLWSHEIKNIALGLGIGYQIANGDVYRTYKDLSTRVENPKYWDSVNEKFEEWDGERNDTDPQLKMLEKRRDLPKAPAYDSQYAWWAYVDDKTGQEISFFNKGEANFVHKKYRFEFITEYLERINKELTANKKELKELEKVKEPTAQEKYQIKKLKNDVEYFKKRKNKIETELQHLGGDEEQHNKNLAREKELVMQMKEFANEVYNPNLFESTNFYKAIKNFSEKRKEKAIELKNESDALKQIIENYNALHDEKNRVNRVYESVKKFIKKGARFTFKIKTYNTFHMILKNGQSVSIKMNDYQLEDIRKSSSPKEELNKLLLKQNPDGYYDLENYGIEYTWFSPAKIIEPRAKGGTYKPGATMRPYDEGELEAVQNEVIWRTREWNNRKLNKADMFRSSGRAIDTQNKGISFEEMPTEDPYLSSTNYEKAKEFFDSIVAKDGVDKDKEQISFRFPQRIFGDEILSGEDFLRQRDFERSNNYLPNSLAHYSFNEFNTNDSGNIKEGVRKNKKEDTKQSVDDAMAPIFRLLFKDDVSYKNWIRSKASSRRLKQSGKNAYTLTLSFGEFGKLYDIFNKQLAKYPSERIALPEGTTNSATRIDDQGERYEIIEPTQKLALESALSRLYDAFLRENKTKKKTTSREDIEQSRLDKEFINRKFVPTEPKRKREYVAESLGVTHIGRNKFPGAAFGHPARELAPETIRLKDNRRTIVIQSTFNQEVYTGKLRNVNDKDARLGAALSNFAPSPIIWRWNEHGQVTRWLDNERVYQATKVGFVNGTDKVNEKIRDQANNPMAMPRDVTAIDSRKAYPLMVDINTEKFLQSAKWLKNLQDNDYFEDVELVYNLGNANADFWEMGGHVAALRDAFARVKNRIEEWKKEGYDTTDEEFLKAKVQEHISNLTNDFYEELAKTRALGDYHPPRLTAKQEGIFDLLAQELTTKKTEEEQQRDFVEGVLANSNHTDEIRFKVPFAKSTDGAAYVFKRIARELIGNIYDENTMGQLYLNPHAPIKIERDNRSETGWVLVIKNGETFKKILDQMKNKPDFKNYPKVYRLGIQKLAMNYIGVVSEPTPPSNDNSTPTENALKENKASSKKETLAEDFKQDDIKQEDVPFSHLNITSNEPIEQQQRKALDYIQGVLGDQVGVVFKDSAWGEKKDVVGEFSKKDSKRLITLAMTGDIISTAHHEAFHAFLSTLHNKAPKHYERLLSLSEKYKDTTLEILARLSPEAQKSARTNKEELAAYTYQLQMSGLMPSNALSRKVCGKIQQMLYRIGGLFNQAWREKANANADALNVETSLLAVYRKFNEGAMRTEFSQKAFLKQLNTDLAEKKHNETINKAAEFFGKWGDKLFNSADAVLRRPNIPELNELADLFYNDVVDRDLNNSLNGATGEQQGDFTLRIFAMRNRWVSMYSKIIADLTTQEKSKIRRALLMHNMDEVEQLLSSDKRLLNGFKAVRNFMDQVYDDLVEKQISSRVVEEWIDEETGKLRQKVSYVKWTKNTEKQKGNKYRRNYFPFVWDKSAIELNKDEFVSLLTDEIQDAVNKKLITLKEGETAQSHAEYITASLLDLNPQNTMNLEKDLIKSADMAEFIHGTPYGSATEKRYLGFILNRDKFDKFFEQDMDNVITDYVIRMSKRAIYQNIFGENGARVWHLLHAAEEKIATKHNLPKRDALMELDPETGKELYKKGVDPVWAKQQLDRLDELMRPYHQAVSAMCGMLGQDLAVDSPLRKINALGVTYQNIRLLTFSLFTSFQDVAGLFIHGGTMEDAWQGFCRGLKEIKNSWLKNVSKDELSEMAADFGVVDPLSYIGSIGELNGTQYMTGRLRGYSNKFFRYIGLEGWNRGLKIQAMVIAERRIKQWKNNGVSDNKADQLLFKRCYGNIKPESIEFEDNHVKLNNANMYAINRMVADMIMTPTAANRPAWASNPRFLLFAQLKTFTYTMHRVLLRGMLEQARLGNLKPAAFAFASLFPMAAAGYMVKEFLLGMIDDDDDDWKWQARNMVPYIFQRAGALGVPQMYLEDFLSGDWARMFGPSADQIQNILSIPFAGMWNISQNHTPYKELISATPMASLIKRLPYVYDS